MGNQNALYWLTVNALSSILNLIQRSLSTLVECVHIPTMLNQGLDHMDEARFGRTVQRRAPLIAGRRVRTAAEQRLGQRHVFFMAAVSRAAHTNPGSRLLVDIRAARQERLRDGRIQGPRTSAD